MSSALVLSARLRSCTRQAHLDAETAIDLDRRLATRSTYAGLLRALHSFFVLAESSLGAVVGWDNLDPSLDIADRQRAHLLDADLTRLGNTAVDDPATRPELLQPSSLAQGLGVLYVLEGSALGGQFIATRARRALGVDLPVSFFTSVGRPDPRSSWKAMQQALDNFALRGTERDSIEAIAAAEATFGALSDWLSLATVTQ